jgi:hypothetical protein
VFLMMAANSAMTSGSSRFLVVAKRQKQRWLSMRNMMRARLRPLIWRREQTLVARMSEPSMCSRTFSERPESWRMRAR